MKTTMRTRNTYNWSVTTLICLCFSSTSMTTIHGFQLPTKTITGTSLGPSRRVRHGRIEEQPLSSSLTMNVKDDNHNDDDGNVVDVDVTLPDRRRWISRTLWTAMMTTTAGFSLPPMIQPANAILLKFPITEEQPLKNIYHFMRAGPSELELDNIYSTNPLFLTNRENEMNQELGTKVILQALKKLQTETSYFPTVAYHSLAANGMDTGDLIARELRLGREKLLPEFTYLDQRGVGLWDSGDAELIKPAVWALDYLEGGDRGMGGRPPPNEDGTPNETLADQFIRLRQFISLQESRTSADKTLKKADAETISPLDVTVLPCLTCYNLCTFLTRHRPLGETILVIFPDGTGPALLSCMIGGVPFRHVHALEYEPGEIRFEITYDRVQALYQEKKDDPTYLATLEDGKEKLKFLRQQKSITGLKEQLAEKERITLEQDYEKKKIELQQQEVERQAKLKEQKEAQVALQKEKEEKAQFIKQQREEKLRLEKERQQELARQQYQAQKLKREEKERERQRKFDQVASGGSAPPSSSNTGTRRKAEESSSSFPLAAVAGGGLGVVGLGLVASMGFVEDDSTTTTTTTTMTTTTKDDDDMVQANTVQQQSNMTVVAVVENVTDVTSTKKINTTSDLVTENKDIVDTIKNETVLATNITTIAYNTSSATTSTPSRPSEEEEDDEAEVNEDDDDLMTMEEDWKELEVVMKEAISSSSTEPASTTKADEEDDDGGMNDWLRVLGEIRDEEDGDNDDENDDTVYFRGVNGDSSYVWQDDSRGRPDVGGGMEQKNRTEVVL